MKPIVVAIIDDDQLYHLHVKIRLSTLSPGSRTIAFLNGKEGLDFLSSNAGDGLVLPDCIFLDIEMPVMNGWQFLEKFQQIRANFNKSIKIYIFSSLTDIQHKLNGYSFLDGCLEKPFNKEQLDSILNKLLKNGVENGTFQKELGGDENQ